jgi:hypothetical protein
MRGWRLISRFASLNFPHMGSPPYSLLTIDDVPDLATWIEVCAATWQRR